MSERTGTEGTVIELTGIGQLRDFLSRADERTLVSITVEYADGGGRAGQKSKEWMDGKGEMAGGTEEQTGEEGFG